MNIFYCIDIKNHEALLSPEESAHCIRVLRMEAGDRVQVIDGKGGLYEGSIVEAHAQRCRIGRLEVVNQGKVKDFSLHIAIAPTKNTDRFEWFIEKSVEIGIDTITPLLCERSERRILKTDRLHKLIISTMKQAIIPVRPLLNELTGFDALIGSDTAPGTQLFIAHCLDDGRKKLKDQCRAGGDVVVLIGPEGDFTPAEIDRAVKRGYIPVTLGENRLRTETAGIVACHAVGMINEK